MDSAEEGDMSKMDFAEEDKPETGSAEALLLRSRELLMVEYMGSRNVQAVVDQEEAENMVPVRPYLDMVMPEEALSGIHTEFVAEGSRFRMDIGRCLRMLVLAGHWPVSAG
jgi:hypothetical protein